MIILTNAHIGAPEIYSSNKNEQIRNEARKANKFIGTKKLFFENLPVLNLNNYPHYKIANLINTYINNINPDIALIPSPNDINDDHKIIFKCAKVAMRTNKENNLKKILSYETLSETEWNENEKSLNPNYLLVLDKNDINNKAKVFLQYKSQIKKYPHPRSKEENYKFI